MELAREEFAGSGAGPHLLITGGVHGDEFESMAAIRRLIAHFRERPPIRGRVTLVPVVNQPAFRRCNRAAEDGLDLARTCPGKVDGSITERIAHSLSALIRTADYYIDLHTGGTHFRVMPLAGYTLHPDSAVLAAQRRMAHAFGLPIIWGTDPTLNGRSLSVARDAKVPAIYTEYEGGGGCDPAGVDAFFDGCLRVLADLGIINTAPPASKTKPLVVEESQAGSGHMQANHPSPCEGYFETAVKLGQSVKTGDLLGYVVDVLGRSSTPIHAKTSGMILMLRTFCRVDADQGLAVVIPGEHRP